MMTIKRFGVWLDLEGTVIDTFNKRNLLVVQAAAISKFLTRLYHAHQLKSVHIFSYAIWHEHDREVFNHQLRQHLQNYFMLQFDQVPCVTEMCKTVGDFTRISCDSPTDFIIESMSKVNTNLFKMQFLY